MKNELRHKTIVGITGGLASGKTTVADMFVFNGAGKIDADAISHKLLREDDIKLQIIDLFGESVIVGGEIDRRKLASEVFSDSKKLNSLTEILHPKIIRQIKKEVAEAAETMIVIDAPLLIEAGLHDYVDIVIVVTAGKETMVKRAVNRGIPEEEALGIIDKQMPISQKVKFADYIINNDENVKQVKEGVDKVWQKI